MLKYPCLVFDHDDTVVCSEDTVNYPAFLEALRILRPGMTVSLPDFIRWTFQEGFVGMCANHFDLHPGGGLDAQYEIWLAYVMEHIPPAYPGIDRILARQRQAGGLICVSSHSARENILRDYRMHFGLEPDRIFAWDLGTELRKPAPYALDCIMEEYGLKPSDILVIDDLNTGSAMAQARGVDFAWAGWGRPGFPEIAARMESLSKYSFHTTKALEEFLFGS